MAEEKSNDPPKRQAPDVFVKGGTRTARSENLFEQRFQEGEERRDVAEAERKLSAKQQEVAPEDGKSILMPGNTGGAVTYTNQFTDNPDVPKAYLKIRYLDRMGQDTGLACLADLIQMPTERDPDDLCVIIVCPKCQLEGVKHQQDNQLRILRSNKYFDFQPGRGPAMFDWQEPDGLIVQRYASAGMIVESESFECPDCGMQARIVNNCLRPG